MTDSIRELIREALGYTVTSYGGGMFWIILGIYMFRDVYKNPVKSHTMTYSHYSGWFGSIFCVSLGVWVLAMKISGEL